MIGLTALIAISLNILIWIKLNINKENKNVKLFFKILKFIKIFNI